MATIKTIFGFLFKTIGVTLKIAGAICLSATKIMLVLTFAAFKIVFSLIRIAEYN